MIISNFTGNLGNHMWIYAVTRAVAEHNGYEWGFNPVTEYDYFGGQSQMGFMEIDYGREHDCKYDDVPEWIKYIWKEKHQMITFPNGEQTSFHYFQPEVFDIEDDTKLYIDCCQDARYLQGYKENIKEWFHIRDDYAEIYKKQLADHDMILDENLTVINVRGGEYRGIPSLSLKRDYYDKAIAVMKKRNPDMEFLCVSDDPIYASTMFDAPTLIMHMSIGCDYYAINNAKNLILSNSSFTIFPAWLNENNPYVIAPRYWARHNISDGQWSNTDMWTFGWNYLDKDGTVYGK